MFRSSEIGMVCTSEKFEILREGEGWAGENVEIGREMLGEGGEKKEDKPEEKKEEKSVGYYANLRKHKERMRYGGSG